MHVRACQACVKLYRPFVRTNWMQNWQPWIQIPALPQSPWGLKCLFLITKTGNMVPQSPYNFLMSTLQITSTIN